MTLKNVYKKIVKLEYLIIGEICGYYNEEENKEIKTIVEGFPYRDKEIEEYIKNNGSKKVIYLKPCIQYAYLYGEHKFPALIIGLEKE